MYFLKKIEVIFNNVNFNIRGEIMIANKQVSTIS
jgi:hypothetical protein